jgi:hypothetical protein
VEWLEITRAQSSKIQPANKSLNKRRPPLPLLLRRLLRLLLHLHLSAPCQLSRLLLRLRLSWLHLLSCPSLR